MNKSCYTQKSFVNTEINFNAYGERKKKKPETSRSELHTNINFIINRDLCQCFLKTKSRTADKIYPLFKNTKNIVKIS